MHAELTNKQKGELDAAERGAAKLREVDIAARCASLGLSVPDSAGAIRLRVFGQDLLLTPPEYPATVAASGGSARQADRVLAIHYLLCPGPVRPTNEWISFRDFPGGQFYFGPFCSRSVKPLIARIGNDIDLLRERLSRFEHAPLDISADLSARIQAVGAVDVALIYRRGDDEMTPTIELLFDACAKRVFNAEDASVIASRVCLGLL